MSPAEAGTTRRDARWAGLTALATALAAFIAAMIGIALFIDASSNHQSIAARGLFALTAVLLITRLLGSRATRRGLARPTRVVLIGAFLGYLLNPFSWDGRVALTQLAAEAGLVTFTGDLILWMLIAGLGTWWGVRRAPARKFSATPYG